jgi:(1->4)-alpha-D-glucan 1-alpha-D-glucosylmutase
MESPADGRVKLFVIRQALGVRRRHAELFARGDYRPLEVSGAGAEHICAFARTGAGGPTVTIVPRLLAARGEPLPVGDAYWGDTSVALPADVATFDGPGAVKVPVPLRNAFTGAPVEVDADGTARRVRVGRVLADFPVALLEAIP